MGMNTSYGSYKNLSATGNVSATACALNGFYVNNTAAGTIVLRDGGASGTVMTGTITPAIGWHTFPVAVGGILHATLANIDVTFSFLPTPSAA